jgi:hypothetical protein
LLCCSRSLLHKILLHLRTVHPFSFYVLIKHVVA